MKRIVLIVLAAFVCTTSVPVFAEMTKEQKDECLLASKGCAHEVDTLKQKIKRLDAEIKKGKKVYSAEDLKKLEAKLKEAEDMADSLLKNP